MGQHTERLRELIKSIPKDPRGLTPEVASMFITQAMNASLQVISQLEESMEDLEKENARLAEMLLEKHPISDWSPYRE